MVGPGGECTERGGDAGVAGAAQVRQHQVAASGHPEPGTWIHRRLPAMGGPNLEASHSRVIGQGQNHWCGSLSGKRSWRPIAGIKPI